MCTKGSGPRGLVTGYDIFKCADCTCRPQRQPDEFSEIECPAGAPPPEVALVVVCCKSAPAQDGEIEVLTPEEAAAGDAWYSLAANKVAICHTVVVRTLGYHTEPIESSILHFLAERYDTMPQMVFFARAANTWLDQVRAWLALRPVASFLLLWHVRKLNTHARTPTPTHTLSPLLFLALVFPQQSQQHLLQCNCGRVAHCRSTSIGCWESCQPFRRSQPPRHTFRSRLH